MKVLQFGFEKIDFKDKTQLLETKTSIIQIIDEENPNGFFL